MTEKSMSANQKFYSQSEGIPSEVEKDQYADGKAARSYNELIGDSNQRTQKYKDFLIGLLKKHGCELLLDAACGTGIDSIMLVEEGFKVVSVDASDKMLKQALKARWEKRKDPKYDQWVIEEANWETLPRDVDSFMPGKLFDAVICLGNSFAHLLDEYDDQRIQKMCLKNLAKCLRPGGLLFIDHRNYDYMIDSGAVPTHSLYFNSKYPVDIKSTLTVVSGKPKLFTLDYCMYISDGDIREKNEFRLFFYPHKLSNFSNMLDEAFEHRAKHHIYADFKHLEEVPVPEFYIHVMEKPME